MKVGMCGEMNFIFSEVVHIPKKIQPAKAGSVISAKEAKP